jgi:hypothetical protein
MDGIYQIRESKMPTPEEIETAKRMASEPRVNDIYPYARIAESPVPAITAIECIKQSYGWSEGDWCQWIQEACSAHERKR